MKNKIKVIRNVLTNTIFAGKKLKDGRWAAGSKTDVTTDCLITTAEYVKTFGNPVEITDINGNLIYKIIVKSNTY